MRPRPPSFSLSELLSLSESSLWSTVPEERLDFDDEDDLLSLVRVCCPKTEGRKASRGLVAVVVVVVVVVAVAVTVTDSVPAVAEVLP